MSCCAKNIKDIQLASGCFILHITGPGGPDGPSGHGGPGGPDGPYDHITKGQKDSTCGIFFKSGLFKEEENLIIMGQTHKYTNTAFDEVPGRPSLQFIFEKRIVQEYQNCYV